MHSDYLHGSGVQSFADPVVTYDRGCEAWDAHVAAVHGYRFGMDHGAAGHQARILRGAPNELVADYRMAARFVRGCRVIR